MRDAVCVAVGAVGSSLAGLFGGWDMGLATLCIFMALDYITGLICAAVFHTSPKSKSGALESGACIKGLFRKGGVLLVVLIAHRLDLTFFGGSYLRDAVCISFMLSESISITENLGLMGVPIPERLARAIDALRQKGERHGTKDGEG